MKAFVHLLLVVYCVVHTQADVNDGGADGVDGRTDLFNGTPNTQKLRPHVVCSRETSDHDILDIELSIYEADSALTFNGGGRNNNDVRFKSCFFLDVAVFNSNGTRTAAAGCALSLIDGVFSVNTDNVAERTWYEKQSINTTSSDALECGALLNTDDFYELIVECKREQNIDKYFDEVIRFLCPKDKNDDRMIARRIETDQMYTGEIASVKEEFRYKVDFDLYTQPTAATADGPKSLPSSLITEPIRIGAVMYFEVCLDIVDNRTFFGNFSTMGIRAYDCYMKLAGGEVDTTDPFYQDPDNVALKLIDEHGCAAKGPVGIHSDGSDYCVKWLDDSTPETKKDYLRPPNCFRSCLIEVFRFKGARVGGFINQTVECSLDYCNSWTDPNCFGDLSGTYPVCPIANRTARDVRDGNEAAAYYNLPTKVSASFTVKVDDYGDASPTTATRGSCSDDQTAFIVITVILTVFLLGVLAFAMLVIVKFQSSMSEYRQIANDGYQNKGYL